MDDVTSHIAASVDKRYTTTNPSNPTTDDAAVNASPPSLRVSLLHNPSHLEIVGSVAAGS